MKGLIFGAGNIGRGFLGLLLSEAGFNVTFVDIDSGKVGALEAGRAYPVHVVSGSGSVERVVRGVRAISASDHDSIERAVIETDIILTAVGKDALRFVAPSLARGLVARATSRPREHLHVAVVACENVQDNTTFLRDLILGHLDVEDQRLVLDAFSFPDCVVDRIVPNTLPRPGDSALAVDVEEYFQLAVDMSALRSPLPQITGIELSPHLGATLEQKLCTLNMAHAIVGYFGFLRGHVYVHEAVGDRDISVLLDGALGEVSAMLTARHASISVDAQAAYASKILTRFANPHLKDEIVRVARQPRRKLGKDDRLIKPALLAHEHGRVPAFLASGITAALHFSHAADSEAASLVTAIRRDGIDRVLHDVSGLDRESEVARMVKADYLLRAL